jgi:PAS domain S-box-containing protein
LLLLFSDITGRKEAEEQIREQAALLDKAQDAIFVLNLDDRIIYWNKSAERIYGWTAAEAIGKSRVELLYKGVVSPQLANAIKTVNERGEWVGELQNTTKDGKTITVQGRCNVIRDEHGCPKSQLIINTDITEKKNLEIQSLRSQRMEGIGALAGGIAHDLNNVLTPLLVSVQMLKEKVTDEDGRKLLQALEANVQRGARLVKQVLGFGRGVTGERIQVQPKHIAHEIKQVVHETFPKSVEFESHTAADLWTITGDPTQLHQVLLNLCLNARDAMPKGGKLSILMDNMMFDETYAEMNPEAKAGPYVCITVTDNGTGIPREIQNKIFDPFFTTKEPGKGTGLGLSTTLTIVKSHGGFIHCHSTPGKGSRFEVYFPANISRAVEENAITEEFRLPRGHNELVLLVDDEEPIRKIAKKTLERFGYRVLLAADGAEAVSLYASRQQEISVVITDMVMPIMDGPAAIVALKIINPDVKIVSSSGLASNGGMAKARDAGVRHFIPKPYTTATVLNTLHEVLNGKR